MNITKIQRNKSDDLKYSIVIPTWNNLDYLKLVIRSIRENSTFKHQIILHINEGIDGTFEWVQQQQDIDYCFSKDNIGICYAMNCCRSLVKTNYLVYINDDMYLLPEWDLIFEEEIAKRDSKNFFLSGTLIEPDGQDCSINADFGRNISEFREQDLLANYKRLKKNDWLGSTWPISIVHIDIWDLVGGYSIEFSPGMYSDPDFSMKLWKSGVRYFKGLGESRAYHFGSKSTKRVNCNNGRKSFILKWGITSKTFTTRYLRRGEAFEENIDEAVLSAMDKLINKIKHIFEAIT